MAAIMGTGKTGTPAFATRGIIEGFYGSPWSHEQRLDIIEFISSRGMNTFVYAPKDDPLVRFRWRQPYGGNELSRLGDLVAQCQRHEVDFVYCLSPGLSIEYSSEADRQHLSRKLDSVAALGVRSFGLLLDDIPGELQHLADRERFSDLAEAHQHIVTAVYRDLLLQDPLRRLVVCPTVYWGYGDEKYIARLGRGLDPRIDVFWTGRAICSSTLDLADAATVTRTLARPVTYWDNYPVNDVAMGNELHIGPYRGRDRHLHRFASGVIANGMALFESSKIAFATIADYLWSPEEYHPDSSWQAAIRDVMGKDDDAAAFVVFADNVRSSCLEQEDAPIVTHAVEQFAFHASRGNHDQASAGLAAVVRRLEVAAGHLLSGTVANCAIIAESRPWLEAFEIGARALGVVSQRCAGGTVDAETAADLARYLSQFRSTRKRVYGDTLEMTLSDLIASSSGSPG